MSKYQPPLPTNKIPEHFRKRAVELLKHKTRCTRDPDTPDFESHKDSGLRSSKTLEETPEESRIRMLHVVHRHTAKSMSRAGKVKYVLLYCRELERKLKFLNKNLNSLKELVAGVQLPEEISAYPRGWNFRKSQIIALKKIHRPNFHEAKSNRLDMEVLYECCSRSLQPPKLELHIITREGEAFGGKLFPILIPQSERGIIAEIFGDRASGLEIGNLPKSFDDACKKVHRDGQSHLYASANDPDAFGNGRRTTWFKLRNATRLCS